MNLSTEYQLIAEDTVYLDFKITNLTNLTTNDFKFKRINCKYVKYVPPSFDAYPSGGKLDLLAGPNDFAYIINDTFKSGVINEGCGPFALMKSSGKQHDGSSLIFNST
jgi:hypothetical protein